MPEGDTVHKVAAALRPTLEGQVIRQLRLRPGPRAALGPGFADTLRGRRVQSVRAWGKHLFLDLEGGVALRTHLGLYGSWHRYRPGEPWKKPASQATLVLETERDVLVCFNAREVECVEDSGFRRADFFRRLGPDLLAEEGILDEAVDRARGTLGPEVPVVDVLLDQRVAAGIGNVYKSEVLFLAGVRPDRPLGDTPDAVLLRLFETARRLMGRNLGGGPRTTRFAEDGRGRLWVYKRAGLGCLRCGTPIRSARLGRGQRSTYWCPRCQA